MAILYGDGIHDDFEAIQEMLDSGSCLVSLPVPQKYYSISKTLKIHSNQQLVLPRYARIRMADGANCYMLTNADPINGTHDFSVIGGIWDYNNLGQAPNPFLTVDPKNHHMPDPRTEEFYIGFMFFFYNVKNFRIADITLKDPINFCITLDRASYFTVENLTFDFNRGNPGPLNMDGVHLNGNCHYGVIRNCKGTCYDDLVALNADEGSDGPITHIEVDGLFAEDCHSAVRLLTGENAVEHIHIRNVHGTYYQYCIGFTKHFPKDEFTGWFDDVTLENIHVSKATRYSWLMKDDQGVYPLIWFESRTYSKNILIRNRVRKEKIIGIPLIRLDSNSTVDSLTAERIIQQDSQVEIPAMIDCRGTVGCLRTAELRTDTGDILINTGTIRKRIGSDE